MVIKKKLLLVLLFSTALLVVVLAFMLDYRRSSSELLLLFEVSRQRRLRLNELSVNVKDIQRSHRGYVITHQPEFLEPYDAAVKAIPRLLQQVTTDLNTSEQRVLTDSLARAVDKKIAYVEMAIEQVRNGQYHEAIAGIGTGRVLLDDIILIIHQLEDIEREVIRTQSRKVQRRANVIFGIAMTGLLTSSLLLIWALSAIYRGQRKIEYLHSEVDERTMQLGISREALIRANQELSAANAALTKANEELNDFSYSISHDLKAPLRIVSGYCEMLLDDVKPATEREKKLLHGIIQNTRRMEHLISDLLELSRLGKRSLVKKEFNMKEIVDEVLSDKALFPGTQLTVHSMNGAKGDPDLLRQVWENLVSNAIKFSSTSGKIAIEIGYREGKDEQVYWISDTGVGFDPAYSDKLFKVFSRLHGKKEFEGTGAGLAIARKIVEAHGGRIWAKSEESKGATFYFSLPKN